jgi:hypothetical protein
MRRVRYDEPCIPSLNRADQRWADHCWAAYRAAHADLVPPQRRRGRGQSGRKRGKSP